MSLPTKLHYAPFSCTMTDGTQVTFAPIGPQHRQHIVEGFERLSQASRYVRFGHPVNSLTEKELQYLTEVDQQHHVAWGALVVEAGAHHGIAVGRYIHVGELLGRAEFALTVIDAYQNKGIGSYMLALLYVLALRQGIHTLSGSIMPTNGYAADRMTALGATITVENGLYYANLPIMAATQKLDTEYGRKFAQLLAKIDAKLVPATPLNYE